MSECWSERRKPWTPQIEDARSPWDTDYARIINGASFRRLQGKTQVLNLGDSDFYRTRLTHSLEVAQIAAGIVAQLERNNTHPAAQYLPDRSLIQAISLAHDLGHPPFGHGGEISLNYCMRECGGFEGNGQTLRIISRLEKMSSEEGSNLTRRAMLGILKYPVAYSRALNRHIAPCLDDRQSAISIIDRNKSKPPKCYLDSEADIFDWLAKPLCADDRTEFESMQLIPSKHSKSIHKSFDCSIMDVSDDIAYGVHDLEDAIAIGLITESDFRNAVPESSSGGLLDWLKNKYRNHYGNNVYDEFVGKLFSSEYRKMCINLMMSYIIPSAEVFECGKFLDPLLRYRARLPEMPATLLSALKDLVRETVILSPRVQHLEFKGQRMVVSVFEALQSEPKSFLPPDFHQRYLKQNSDPRIICDYIAGMTDTYLLKTYERLFSPRMGSVFDKL
jgi:dGTPase